MANPAVHALRTQTRAKGYTKGSLVERWLKISQATETNRMTNELPGESVIERDANVLADICGSGTGRSSSVVVFIHGKHYNKWLMSKVSQK